MLAAPQRPRICLQQACSEAVIPEAGSAQAMAGARRDINVRRAGPIRVTACTSTSVANLGQRRRLQQLPTIFASTRKLPIHWRTSVERKLRCAIQIRCNPKCPEVKCLPCKASYDRSLPGGREPFYRSSLWGAGILLESE